MYHDGFPDSSIGIRAIPKYPTASDRRSIRLLYFACALMACTALVILFTAKPAGSLAQSGSVPAEESLGGSISLDASVIAIISGFVIPLVTSLLTKLNASTKLKAFLNLIFAAAVATFSEVIVANSGTFELQSAIVYFFLAVGSTLGSYNTIVKPNHLDAKLAPGVGLGSSG